MRWEAGEARGSGAGRHWSSLGRPKPNMATGPGAGPVKENGRSLKREEQRRSGPVQLPFFSLPWAYPLPCQAREAILPQPSSLIRVCGRMARHAQKALRSPSPLGR